ncbi:hypothetical protein Tco_0564897 [Tanacetum coccineum]
MSCILRDVSEMLHPVFSLLAGCGMLEGLLIAGKEDLMCVETLESLGGSNRDEPTRDSHLEPDMDTLLYQKHTPKLGRITRVTFSWKARLSSGRLVELWRLILLGANPIPHR